MRLLRRLAGPVAALVLGGLAMALGGALLLTDHWLQSGDPEAEGRLPAVLSFTAEDASYTVRLGRRRGIGGDGPTVRVGTGVATSAVCEVELANEKRLQLRRPITNRNSGGITPAVGSFEGVPGTTRVGCRWIPSEAWRGDIPFFVARQRATLRRIAYVVFAVGGLLLLAGGARLAFVLVMRGRTATPTT